MSIAEVKDNIVNLLENIIKRSEIIERQSGSRNLLEIDLAMEDIRLLYREMDKLRQITESDNGSGTGLLRERLKRASDNNEDLQQQSQAKVHTPEVPAPAPAPESKQAQPAPPESKPVEQAKPVIEKPAPIKEETTSPEPVVNHEPVKEPVAKQEPPKAPEKEAPVAQSKPEPAPRNVEPKQQTTAAATEKKEKNSMLVGETFKTSENALYERLARIKEDSSIGTRMQQKPIENLKDAIGLNEKFLFINELFSGDIKAYNDSIGELNSCPSIHEAFELLNKLTSTYHWDGQRSGETIEKFANLVQRRHMS